ncbi:MAG: NAD(P)H-dependent oxidoreductase subunit E [Clostridia bacterium]|nr:NAD(P)H-dependent oxidoreductase subunit E [Clostridia bacterium]
MKISEILDKNGRTPDKLISSLLEYQNSTLCNYLTEDDLREFAEETGIPLSRISSVASFYSLLSTESRGKYIIQVCYDVPCYVNNSVNIVEELEKNLGIKMGQTTEDELFTLEFSSCLGCCDKAPVMQIGENLYGNLTRDKIISILDSYRRKNNEQ